MAYSLLFLFELILLFFLSKTLIKSLASLVYRLTRSHNFVVNFLAILFLPGTIIHELAHLLTAGVLFVPVGEIEIMPVVHEDGVQLGSVQIGHTDPFRRMIIGVAPVLVGITGILGILYFAQKDFSPNTPIWQIALTLYLIFEIGNTMFSSKKDMEGAAAFLLTLLILFFVLLGALSLFGINLMTFYNNILSVLNAPVVSNFFKTASFYLVIPIGIDLSIYLAAEMFRKH